VTTVAGARQSAARGRAPSHLHADVMMAKTKPLVAILFTSPHLAYAPTVLNLYAALAACCDVHLIAFSPSDVPRVTTIPVRYVECSGKTLEYRKWQVLQVLRRCGCSKSPIETYGQFVAFHRIREAMAGIDYDHVIAVDFEALWIAQSLSVQNVHFLSLEITPSPFERKVDKQRIQSVIIQREDRFLHVFNGIPHRVFLVQNAPRYVPIDVPTDRRQCTLLFAGTAVRGFGIHLALNFVQHMSQCTVYIKGRVPRDVLEDIYCHYNEPYYEGRIVIDEEYVAEADITDFIKRFRIGLCFYDLRYPEINTFNYVTAPSGKLFKYFAAGVPVIGSDIPGLSYVREFQAGVLLSDYSARSIQAAMDQIESDYDRYVANSLRAAQAFDFDTMVHPFIDYLLNGGCR